MGWEDPQEEEMVTHSDHSQIITMQIHDCSKLCHSELQKIIICYLTLYILNTLSQIQIEEKYAI